MKKRVILTLEYDMGEGEEEDGSEVSTDIKIWKEIFYQGDVFPCDMEIKNVRIEEREGDTT